MAIESCNAGPSAVAPFSSRSQSLSTRTALDSEIGLVTVNLDGSSEDSGGLFRISQSQLGWAAS